MKTLKKIWTIFSSYCAMYVIGSILSSIAIGQGWIDFAIALGHVSSIMMYGWLVIISICIYVLIKGIIVHYHSKVA